MLYSIRHLMNEWMRPKVHRFRNSKPHTLTIPVVWSVVLRNCVVESTGGVVWLVVTWAVLEFHVGSGVVPSSVVGVLGAVGTSGPQGNSDEEKIKLWCCVERTPYAYSGTLWSYIVVAIIICPFLCKIVGSRATN